MTPGMIQSRSGVISGFLPPPTTMLAAHGLSYGVQGKLYRRSKLGWTRKFKAQRRLNGKRYTLKPQREYRLHFWFRLYRYTPSMQPHDLPGETQANT